MIEGIMRRMNRDQYKEARGEQEFMQKLRKRAHANNLKREEFEAKRGRLPVDYQYQNTSDEDMSDYEVENKDIYPK